MISIYQQILNYSETNNSFQLGLLLEVKGSAPQCPGSMALFNKDKVLLGTLGGGLVEQKAQREALNASISNKSTIKSIQLSAEIDDKEGAICGGSATFLIDAYPKLHVDAFSNAINSLQKKRCGVMISLITHHEDKLNINKYWVEKNAELPNEISCFLDSSNVNIQELITNRKSVWLKQPNSNTNSSVFIEPIHPLAQLIIIGAGHIGQALCKIAQMADFDVTVIDNRLEYNDSSIFNNAQLVISAELNDALNQVAITSNTFIVITTQGHRTDIEALRWCIHSNAAYIGTIGSKRKSALVKKKFLQEDWACEDELNFVYSPIGLNIHAKTVNEIAISITSQLIQKRYEQLFLKPSKSVCSIILAAGKSSRMGMQKLLLPIDGVTIIKTIAEKSINSVIDTTIVVLGSHKNEIQEELKELPLQLIENVQYESGMLSSVQKGISTITKNIDGVLILLGDQPMVPTDLINRLIAVFNKTSKGIIVPTFEGKRGHPLLIDKKYFKEINTLNSEVGLRELLLTNSNDILEIAVQTNVILKDIDTQNDYQIAINNL